MVEMQFIRNNNQYPFYSSNAGTVINTVNAKPVSKNLRSGFVDIELTNISNFNYIRYTLHGKQIYAWVTDVEHLSGNKLYRVHFTTDAYRTYISDIIVGTQFIERSPEPTNLPDAMLGSTDNKNIYFRQEYAVSDVRYRYCVIQMRPFTNNEEWASKTPGQPTPYNYFFCRYDVNNWLASTPIKDLLEVLIDSGRTSNVVTMYSVPYINYNALQSSIINVKIAGENDSIPIPGWWGLAETTNINDIATTYTPLPSFDDDITKTSHSVKLVVPEAGIMSIPDEVLLMDDLTLRRDVDISSGSSNYMICVNNTIPTYISIRGGSLSSIPILSDPYDTYISQNQNTLAVSLLGDVANLGVNFMTGNMMGMGASGATLLSRFAGLEDAKSAIPSNPPAFLGSALTAKENNRFWIEIIRKPYDNKTEVNSRYGYPIYKVENVTIPNQGFLKLQNCSVRGTGSTSVPQWAIQEINGRFNEGIFYV